tara:strand:+ start:726 stop:1700 length:975 start_codon:yes stop_codon:yes gene_type:complete
VEPKKNLILFELVSLVSISQLLKNTKPTRTRTRTRTPKKKLIYLELVILLSISQLLKNNNKNTMAQQLQQLTKAQLIKMVLKQKKKIKSQGAIQGQKTRQIKQLQKAYETQDKRQRMFREQLRNSEQKFQQCVEANKAMVEQLIKEQNKVKELEQLNKDIMEQSLKKTQVIKFMETDVVDSAERLETVIQEQTKMLEQEKANTELFKHQYQQLAEQQQHYQVKADKELKDEQNKVILLEQQNKHYVSEIELLLKHIPKKTTDGSTQTPTPQVVKCVVKTKTSVGVQAQPPQQGMFKYLVVDNNQDEQVVDMDNFYDDDELMAML